ncbi:unnamed protein product [Arctogadus glacialis]
MTKEGELDIKDLELIDMDSETQPMTADGAVAAEKNGTVKIKVPEEEVKFTGLSKDELMKVAGTAGWVRTRWVLLGLFWLGWLGMLAGAIVIIVQAPRCQPIPEMNWWNDGPLYQIDDLAAFTEEGQIKGVVEKLDMLNQLKVKGLLLGPFHQAQANQLSTLDLQKIDPAKGTLEELQSLMEKAHKKGISVVLDLTPNYLGNKPWFSGGKSVEVMEKLKEAAKYWLDLGVDGIKVSDLGAASAMVDWQSIPDTTLNNDTETELPRKKALIGVVSGKSVTQVSELLNTSSVNLLVSDLLTNITGGLERAQAIELLLERNDQRNVGWTLGAATSTHLANEAKTPELLKLYQLLLFTLPGTPVFLYGDEIGLQAQGKESPMMLWDIEKEPEEGAAVNETAEADRKARAENRKWFKTLSDLRGKERSLLHGEYHTLNSSGSALAYLRLWDQSDRYVVAVNWGSAPATLTPRSTGKAELPTEAMVRLSTDTELEVESMVSLNAITLGPGSGVLLQFPFTS